MGGQHTVDAKVAGVILASGMSQRFGEANKLLVPIDGIPVITRTVSAYVAAGLSPTVVVVGFDSTEVIHALASLPVDIVHNARFAEGQSRALVAGVQALPPDIAAVVIGVGDQPLLSRQLIQALVDRWRSTRASIIVPRYGGQRGNPTLFARSLFGELLEVTGDQGGRNVIQRHSASVSQVDWPDARIGADIDTVEEYQALVEEEGGGDASC